MWTHPDLLHNLSRNLKRLRDYMDFLQHEVARALHITPSLMSRWESAERDPGLYGAYKIATYYGITIDDLIDPNFKLTTINRHKEVPVDSQSIDAARSYDAARQRDTRPVS